MESQQSKVCEIIKTTKDKTAIAIDGFILTKDRNQTDRYYWKCEDRKCTGRALTTLVNGQHDINKHDHAAQASRVPVIKACSQMKETAKLMNDEPAQVIQIIKAVISSENLPCMPSNSAMHQLIKRARREERPAEPQSLEEFSLHDECLLTLNGLNFVPTAKPARLFMH